MMRNIIHTLILASGSLLLYSCEPDLIAQIPKEADGYKPIYADPASIGEVSYRSALPVTKAGKIYFKGGYIFQVDQGIGIHIIDATNPMQATRIGFISIIGCQEIAITGNYLFTNNHQDLLTVDISDFTKPQVARRTPGAFSQNKNELPPARGYFECPDTKKGVIVGWQKATLQYPKCSNF